ncbi:hypothetical protein [Tepidibacter thalassicus]|uniref:Uncharacterized protein n=1 Tax=Tepidibacter thalassicus DSM 15285 TaxID=1123350 RepID=A0A1M5P5F2_9FIRM|nr:hypothetical protein [Tepidibacter thalassicus]SHG96443.1 hypothetical protein SAMN02744040_00373 [Tepidibacter thalassicus DSM 15285]
MKNKKIIPPEKLTKYKWGGTTYEWMEETKEINSQIKNTQEKTKSKEKIEKEIYYGNRKQRWN